MIENKEVKIAIVVAIIMITICILAFIFSKSSGPKTETLDIKVYKLFDVEGSDEHEYRPCTIATDDLSSIAAEYRSAMRISENKRTKGQINGNYKIISGNDYIAFDAGEDNYIYRSDTKGLYEYNSELYEFVKKVCE